MYSSDSDDDTYSKKAANDEGEPEVAKPEPTQSDPQSAMSLAERRDIFESSDKSDLPSPRQSHLLDSARGGGSPPQF